MENDAPHSPEHSALFYLLQEVSKLTSPTRSSFSDGDPAWVNETPEQGAFIVEKEEEAGAHSFKISHSSLQRGLCHVVPYNPVERVEESPADEVTSLMEPHPECKSPWKVLSLINLQCEKLLHHSDEEAKPSSVSSAPTSGRLRNKCLSDDSFRLPVFKCGRREIQAYGSPMKDVTVCSGRNVSDATECYVKNSKVGCCVRPQTAKGCDPVQNLVKENGTASFQTHYGDQREDKFSVKQFQWLRENKEINILTVPSENALPQTPAASHLMFNSDVDVNVSLSKPAFRLDHNANLALTTEGLCEAWLCPLRSVLPFSQTTSLMFSVTEKCYVFPNPGDGVSSSEQECKCAPKEGTSTPVAQLKPSDYIDETNPKLSTTSKPESRPVQKEQTVTLSSPDLWRSKARRKQAHPSRSVDIQDPDFKGVMFRMDTELDDSREQCRLLITSKYSKELCKRARKPRMRTRTSQKSRKISSSDEESELTGVSKGKVCASCCTSKTPMWRDAEDGTPLCNACGIRYKKYRVRCINCWHIPRKEGNANSHCLKCGNFVKLTSALLKHSS